MTVESYAPVPTPALSLAEGEAHVHSFRMRGWRWTLGVRDPETLRGVIHVTSRRIVVETEGGGRDGRVGFDVHRGRSLPLTSRRGS